MHAKNFAQCFHQKFSNQVFFIFKSNRMSMFLVEKELSVVKSYVFTTALISRERRVRALSRITSSNDSNRRSQFEFDLAVHDCVCAQDLVWVVGLRSFCNCPPSSKYGLMSAPCKKLCAFLYHTAFEQNKYYKQSIASVVFSWFLQFY